MTKILHVFGPRFFWGRAPRIFGLGLFNPASFRSCGKVSRRSAEGPRRTRGERKKKKKHHEHFIRPPVTTVNGRPKKHDRTLLIKTAEHLAPAEFASVVRLRCLRSEVVGFANERMKLVVRLTLSFSFFLLISSIFLI